MAGWIYRGAGGPPIVSNGWDVCLKEASKGEGKKKLH